MKVLQINAVYGFGSTGIIVQDIENMIMEAGYESYIAYQTANTLPKNGYRIGNKLDWKFHALHTRVFGKQAYASKRATKKLVKWMDSISPDVVHLHNLHSNYINLNILCNYLAKKNIATVLTLHDCWFFTGKCTHYIEENCYKWQNSCGNCPLNKKDVPSWFFDKTGQVLKDKIKHLSKIKRLSIVGCSEWIIGEAKKSLLKSKQMDVVRNGVDIDIFSPHKSDFRNKYNVGNKFIILGMANKWFSDKNYYIANEIISKFKQDLIVIVGCNEEQKELLRKFENVLAIEFIKDRLFLSDIYASSNVFVNLTRADTLPTVNMESLCCGTPVITFDCCGSPELVDSESGFVVAENDIDALINKIEYLKVKALSIDIKKQQRKFNKKACYKKYLDIYKRLL